MEKTARPTHLMIESLNERVSDTRKMVSVGIALVLAFSAATFGLTLGAAEFAKEAHVTGNASVMTDVSGNAVSTKALYRTIGLEDVCAFDAETMATYLAEAKDITLVNNGVNAKYTIAGFEHNLNTNAVEIFTNKGVMQMSDICSGGQSRHLLQSTAGPASNIDSKDPKYNQVGGSGDEEWNLSEWYVRDTSGATNTEQEISDRVLEKRNECDAISMARFAECRQCSTVFSGSYTGCDPSLTGSGMFSQCNFSTGELYCAINHPYLQNHGVPVGDRKKGQQGQAHRHSPYEIRMTQGTTYIGVACQDTHGVPLPGDACYPAGWTSHYTKDNKLGEKGSSAEHVEKVFASICWTTSCDIMLTGVGNEPTASAFPGLSPGFCKITQCKPEQVGIWTSFLAQGDNCCFDANSSPGRLGMNCGNILNNYNAFCNHPENKIYAHSWGTVRPMKCNLPIEYWGGMCPEDAALCATTWTDILAPALLYGCCMGDFRHPQSGLPLGLSPWGLANMPNGMPFCNGYRCQDGCGQPPPRLYAIPGTPAYANTVGSSVYTIVEWDSNGDCTGTAAALLLSHTFEECYKEQAFGGGEPIEIPGGARGPGDPFEGEHYLIGLNAPMVAPTGTGSSSNGGTGSYSGGSSSFGSSYGSSYSGAGYMGY